MSVNVLKLGALKKMNVEDEKVKMSKCIDNKQWCKGPAEHDACIACTIKYINILRKCELLVELRKD